MILHLVLYHIARTAVDLLGDVILQLRTGKGFLLSLGVDQVGWLHGDERIFIHSARNLLFHAMQSAYLPVG